MNLNSCPICHKPLIVKEYHCDGCDVSYKGSFKPAWSDNLSNQQLEFVRLFLIVQGSIKEMEKRLGISYPTVKNRLAEIIRSIANQEDQPGDYTDVFNDLDEGFINVDEAISIIESRRKK